MGELADSFVIVIGAISIFANGVLLMIMLTDPLHYFKSSTTYFIISLTVADLLTGANSCVYGVNRFWPFAEQFTVYLLALFWVTTQASFLTLLAMSMERFLIVKYPFDCRSWITKRRVCISIACIWLISALLGSLILLPPQRAMYVQFCIYSEFFLSVFLIAALYAFILISVRRSQKSLGKTGNYHRGGSQYRARTNTRTVLSKGEDSQFAIQPLGSRSGDGKGPLLDGRVQESTRPLLARKAQPQYRQVKAAGSSTSDDVSYVTLERNLGGETVTPITSQSDHNDDITSQSDHNDGITSQSDHNDGITSQSDHNDGITSQSDHNDGITSQSDHNDGITSQSQHNDGITSQSQHNDGITSQSQHNDGITSQSQHNDGIASQSQHNDGIASQSDHNDSITSQSERRDDSKHSLNKLSATISASSTSDVPNSLKTQPLDGFDTDSSVKTSEVVTDLDCGVEQTLKCTTNQFHHDKLVTKVPNGSNVRSESRFKASNVNRPTEQTVTYRDDRQLLVETPKIVTNKQATITKQPSMSTIQENKLTAVVLLLVGVLVLTVLPYLLIGQLYLGYILFGGGNEHPPEWFDKFLAIYFPIELLNFAVNPLIYAWRLPQYRRTLVYLLSPRKSRLQRGSSVFNRSANSMRV